MQWSRSLLCAVYLCSCCRFRWTRIRGTTHHTEYNLAHSKTQVFGSISVLSLFSLFFSHLSFWAFPLISSPGGNLDGSGFLSNQYPSSKITTKMKAVVKSSMLKPFWNYLQTKREKKKQLFNACVQHSKHRSASHLPFFVQFVWSPLRNRSVQIQNLLHPETIMLDKSCQNESLLGVKAN